MIPLLICLACIPLQQNRFEREAADLAAEIPKADETQLREICDRLTEIGPEARAAIPGLLKRKDYPHLAYTIGRMGPECVPVIRKALRSGSVEQQEWGLSAVGSDPEFNGLYDDIYRIASGNSELRNDAMRALVSLQFHRQRTAKLVVSDLSDPNRAWDAYIALVELDADRSVYRRLRKIAVDHPNPELRRIASICFAKIDRSGQFGLPVLSRLLRDNATVHTTVAFGGGFDEPIGLSVLDELADHPTRSRVDPDTLLHAIKRFDIGQYRFATMAFLLAETNATKTVPFVRRWFEDEQAGRRERVAAAAALLRLQANTKDARNYLISVLTDEKLDANGVGGMIVIPSLRDRAARALGWAPKEQRPTVLPHLRNAMQHRMKNGRPSTMAAEAAWSVARLDRRDLESIKVLALEDSDGLAQVSLTHFWPDSAWYRFAPEVVAEILGDRIAPLVPQLAADAVEYDEGGGMPQFAQRVLLSANPPRATALIRAGFDAMQESDVSDCATPFNWLIKLASKLGPGVDEIKQHCDSPHMRTRAAAVYLLGLVGRDPKSSVPILIEKTKDERVLVRYRAAKALGPFWNRCRRRDPGATKT